MEKIRFLNQFDTTNYYKFGTPFVKELLSPFILYHFLVECNTTLNVLIYFGKIFEVTWRSEGSVIPSMPLSPRLHYRAEPKDYPKFGKH